MWNRVSLTLKITGPLIIMEIMGLVFGGLTLVSKIEKARLKEIDTLLIGQADLIEESLKVTHGLPEKGAKNELFGELDRDPKVFFQIVDGTGTIIYTSKGPKATIQTQISQLIMERAQKPLAPEELFVMSFGGELWRSIKENIEYPDRTGSLLKWQVYTAVDQTASMSELYFIRKLIFGGAILLAIVTSLATAAIVLLTTSNLRLFAQSLAHINPDNPVWNFNVAAQSAEEGLLFTSFGKMMGEMETARQNQKLFIANASHELKTPVAGMMAALEVLLSRERAVADYQAICRDLLKTVKDMRRLTGVLLDTSLIEGGKIQQCLPIDLKTLIETVMDRWKPNAKAHNISLRWQFEKGQFTVMGSLELVDVAISNLLDNAIKYSYQGNEVELHLRRQTDGFIKLSIKDYGVGMNAAEQEKLGDIFFRADVSRSNKDSFGLGFANAKKILHSHGARLLVNSTPKSGTEISILWETRVPPPTADKTS
ncbi:MAG: hypothetical protein H7249_00545 [Chitinophagaceae bacterium]|nr:hypothetical protein [Oligoflexus sp.]